MNDDLDLNTLPDPDGSNPGIPIPDEFFTTKTPRAARETHIGQRILPPGEGASEREWLDSEVAS